MRRKSRRQKTINKRRRGYVRRRKKKFGDLYEGVNWRNSEADMRRRQRYNETVWKGWHREENPSEVKTYNIDELDELRKNDFKGGS